MAVSVQPKASRRTTYNVRLTKMARPAGQCTAVSGWPSVKGNNTYSVKIKLTRKAQAAGSGRSTRTAQPAEGHIMVSVWPSAKWNNTYSCRTDQNTGLLGEGDQ